MDEKQIPALGLEDEFVFQSVHGAKNFWGTFDVGGGHCAIVARHPEIDWSVLR